MFVKNELPRVCELFSSYEEIPQKTLDGTDLVGNMYHIIFDISQSRHRKVRIAKSSNKMSFASKLFHFCDLKTQQLFILQEELNIPKKEVSSLVDILRDFLKTFDETSKCLQIPLQ